jgi:hypothetical protein
MELRKRLLTLHESILGRRLSELAMWITFRNHFLLQNQYPHPRGLLNWRIMWEPRAKEDFIQSHLHSTGDQSDVAMVSAKEVYPNMRDCPNI